MRWFVCLLLAPWLLVAAPPADRIAALAARSPIARQAFWGAKVVDAETGQTVYERNADKLFVPASNVKLFTTALALERLGPDHHFCTRVLAVGSLDAEGNLDGDLCLVGGGDPTLSARAIPYRKGPVRGDPLGPLEQLADAVVEAGVRRIGGDVIGDDRLYVWEPYPPGWAQEDIYWEYGAPVSALTLHDNSFRLIVRPGPRAGAPGRISLNPPVEYYSIHNHVRTVSRGDASVHIEWPPGSAELHVWGSIRRRSGGRAKLLAIRDPAHYAAWALARALRERGVAIGGEVRARHRWMRDVTDFRRAAAPLEIRGAELARRSSPPLFEILKIVNKDSQNLHAELVLREVGRVRRNIGSRAAGLAELGEFLAGAGIRKTEFHFEDGSGLSREDLVTPSAITRLLVYMYLSQDRDGWLDVLPVGGEDGTLSYRFRGAAAGRVLAKTGTLSHVSALSGYLQTRDGGMLAFSILVNNYDAPAAAARKFIDQVVQALLD